MPEHRLLQRQLKRFFGDGLTVPPEWAGLLGAVDEAYRQSDLDRAMLERSLELSSQELLHANSELRAVFEAIPDLLVRIDAEGRILSVKTGADSGFVIPAETLRGKRIQDIPDRAVATLFQDALRRLAERKSMVSFEYSLARDGRPAFYESRLMPRPDGQTVVLIRDITERKTAELEILRLNRLYAVLSETNQAVVQARSRDELLNQVCRAAVELGGFRLAWLGWHDPADGTIRPVVGTGPAIGYLDSIQVSSDLSMPTGRGPAGSAFCEGRSVIIDDFFRDERTASWREPAARHGLASCGIFPVRLNRKVAGLLCVYADTPGQFGPKEVHLLEEVAGDVSFALEHLEAEASRRRTEEHNRQLAILVDSSDDAIVSRTLDDVILTWNRGAVKIYGYAEAEMVGRPMSLLVPTDRQEEIEAIDGQLRRGESVPPFETVRRRKDGHEIEVAITVSPIRDAGGRVIGAVSVARDITEQKHLAAQFLRAQRLDSVGKLAGGIAHDLNNILSPIMMGVPLLRMDVADPKAQSILDTMEASVRRGAQIIRHILVFSRGEELAQGPIQSRHLVREIAEMLEQTLPKSITVQGSFPRDLWLIKADATQMHQVFLNLCVNARDAMPHGGVLTLSGENVELGAAAGLPPEAKPGRYVVWTVSDTGTGIAPEHLSRIFEPFFTTKELDKGTGLGLSTVRDIVRGHGGFVQVTSQPGEGTRFRVYLPATEGAEATSRSTHPVLPTGHGELVLLVDDEFSVRQMMEQVLRTHDYRVITADSGATALAVYRSHAEEIAILVTDLLMPGMSGAELIHQLRSRSPGLKVIAISGLMDRTASGASQMDILADGFLHKPFSAEELVLLMATVLTDRR